jgi:hypothetical protein
MTRRPVRIVLVLFGLLVTAGLGYRAIQDEQALGDVLRDSASLDRSAEEAVSALSDLRASLHAYVAPGQGLPFWAARSSTVLDTLRERLLALDTALGASGGSLAESLDGVDQLAAAEKRARAYTDRGESLLASDVIFIEVGDLLTSAVEQVGSARDALRRDSDGRVAGIRQEQAGLALAAVALWLIIALVMLPGAPPAAVKDPGEWRQNLAVALKKPLESASAREDSGELRRDLAEAASGREGGPGVPAAALRAVGEICADLSALSDVGALSGALARAAEVLGASGVIVWVASNNGGTLSPVASHGFDARLVARIGTIARESSNLTAAAFRENVARVSPPTASTPSALAVAMCGPSGTVGVLSAEFRAGRPVDEACVAMATIFAAQLATLAFPVTAPAVAPRGEESAVEGGAQGARRAAL